MSIPVHSESVGKGLCAALGLANVLSLDLRAAKGEPVTVTVKYYPSREAIDKLIEALKKYELVEKTGGGK